MSLGPIGMSLGASQQNGTTAAEAETAAAEVVRLNALSTEEWKRTHVREGGCR